MAKKLDDLRKLPVAFSNNGIATFMCRVSTEKDKKYGNRVVYMILDEQEPDARAFLMKVIASADGTEKENPYIRAGVPAAELVYVQ